MSAMQPSNHESETRQGETACGSMIPITPDTPHVCYRDEIVYFCGQDCKELYDEYPMNSCMAARLLSGK